ncbi:hypothetical protein HPB50_017575 [Hyalomma asiaticum]|uniref:Uncharacterized protein n=1 Tax=Hyalomma asiaticum TaxID=266040 RepID=A0ACB7S1Z7_HYAAI|nr:hypothetical protein HPB50_017575 [Hyalomma asiaticum]
MGGCWCCAEGCENKARKTKGVCYHRFPSNRALREKWLCAVRRVNWSPSKNACVCSDHFTPDSYKQSVYLMEEFGLAKPNYRRHLKSDAVPTVFWYADHGALLPDSATKQGRSEASHVACALMRNQVAHWTVILSLCMQLRSQKLDA